MTVADIPKPQRKFGDYRRRSPDTLTYGCLYYYTPIDWDFDPLIHQRPAKHQQVRIRQLENCPHQSLRYVAVTPAGLSDNEIIAVVPAFSLSPDPPKRIHTPAPGPCQHRDSGRGVCVECGTFLENKTWQKKTQRNSTC